MDAGNAMQKKSLGGSKKPDMFARKEIQNYIIFYSLYSLSINNVGITASLIVIPEMQP